MKKKRINSLRFQPAKGWVVEKNILISPQESGGYIAPSNLHLENFDEMIQGCLNNNRSSQEQLYLAFYPSMFNLCKKFFANDEDVIEVLNDGMLKVFLHLSSFDRTKGNLFNWMYTIIRNNAIDHFKKNKLVRSTNELHNVFESKDDPVEKIKGRDIYILLDHLTPSTRAVFSLFYLEGFSIREISGKIGISTGTVKWHLSEGRKKILPILRKHIEE